MSATVAGMQTSTTYATPRGVDPSELDRHIAEMYHDVPNRFWVALNRWGSAKSSTDARALSLLADAAMLRLRLEFHGLRE